LDDRPALVMTYRVYNNPLGERDLVDELRKLTDSIYVGIATSRADDGSRSSPGAFFLAGPSRAWAGVGDEAAEAK
jgi:hypothetical protein